MDDGAISRAERAATAAAGPRSERRANERDDAEHSARLDAIFTLARASEIHDEDTGAHLIRIQRVVECIAREMGFDVTDARELGLDAVLHDIGKLRIPPEVLKKPDEFTAYERQIMESHTIRGERLLSDRPTMQRAARIARSHHEAWDGSGYPDGLKGEQIPVEARITAAADVLDALISTRCYKQSWTYDDAVREIIHLSGAKLDPSVVEAVKRCNDDGSLPEIFGLRRLRASA